MKTEHDSLNMWSPEAETLNGLRMFVERLVESVATCYAEPTERTAIKCCENSRFVSDTIEGLLYDHGAIEPHLLSEAIEAIAKAVEAVSGVGNAPQTSGSARAHVQKMINAIAGRGDDLRILQRDGKVAFLQRA